MPPKKASSLYQLVFSEVQLTPAGSFTRLLPPDSPFYSQTRVTDSSSRESYFQRMSKSGVMFVSEGPYLSLALPVEPDEHPLAWPKKKRASRKKTAVNTTVYDRGVHEEQEPLFYLATGRSVARGDVDTNLFSGKSKRRRRKSAVTDVVITEEKPTRHVLRRGTIDVEEFSDTLITGTTTAHRSVVRGGLLDEDLLEV